MGTASKTTGVSSARDVGAKLHVHNCLCIAVRFNDEVTYHYTLLLPTAAQSIVELDQCQAFIQLRLCQVDFGIER